MNSIVLGLICFTTISAGTGFGFYLGRTLPGHHLSTESKDAIKMAWGIVATMSALVLSLLLSSAKTSFDTVNAETAQAGAKIIVLDRILARYGPEAQAARDELRKDVAKRIEMIWSNKNTTGSDELAKGTGMASVQDKLGQLTPTTDAQRMLYAQAQQIAGELVMARWRVVEQARTFLPNVFFLVLIFWLTMLFTGIGLFAPPNKTVLVALFMCNLSLSAALFLIEELNHPLDGVIKVSGTPMRAALEYMNQQ